MFRRIVPESGEWWDIFGILDEEPKGEGAAQEYFEEQQPEFNVPAEKQDPAKSEDAKQKAKCFNRGSPYFGLIEGLSTAQLSECKALQPFNYEKALLYNADGTEKPYVPKKKNATKKKATKKKSTTSQPSGPVVAAMPYTPARSGFNWWILAGAVAAVAGVYFWTKRKKT